MSKTGDYIVVHFVDAPEIGFRFARHRQDWPLHSTLASWFSAGKAPLEKVAQAVQPFQVHVGARQFFGAQHDIPVNILVEQEPMRHLHEKLVQTIRNAGGIFENEQFFGANFRAHITQHDNAAAREGDALAINDFHLVRLLPDNICEVAQRFVLGESS